MTFPALFVSKKRDRFPIGDKRARAANAARFFSPLFSERKSHTVFIYFSYILDCIFALIYFFEHSAQSLKQK